MTETTANVQLFINGARVNGEGEIFPVISPGTEEIIAQVPGASAAQVEAAIKAARAAYDSGSWSLLAPAERVAALTRFMDYLKSQAQRLTDLTIREAGCPVSSMVMMVQVQLPLMQGYQVLDLYQKLPPFEENPLPLNERINFRGAVGQSIRHYRPVGVVAAISSYNYPFFTNLWKVMPALVTGNCVILRPSPLTPLTAMIFGEAAEAAGLPPGVLNVLTERGAEGGVTLSTHPGVDMVAFTGSTLVGKSVMQQAAATMKRLQLELGGKSAQIYLPDSVALAASAAAQVCFAHAGQGCALGTRIFVPESEKAATLQAMAASLQNAVIGNPADKATTMGPVISAAQRDRCERYVAMAVEAGARVVAGGKRPAAPNKGFYFEPTILDTPDNKNPAAQEEIFGPVVSVIGYRDIDHVVEMANDSIYGLSGYVYGKDTNQALAVAARIRTGTVNVNGGMMGAYASSGGWGSSGIGRERGVEGLRVYQQIQVINVQGGGQ